MNSDNASTGGNDHFGNDYNEELSIIQHAPMGDDLLEGTNFDTWRRFYPSDDGDYDEGDGEGEFQRVPSCRTSTPYPNSEGTGSLDFSTFGHITVAKIESPSLPLKTVIVEKEDTIDTIPVAVGEDLIDQVSSLLEQADVTNSSSSSPSPSSCSKDEPTKESDSNGTTIKEKTYTVKEWSEIPQDVLLNWASNIPVTKRRRFGNPAMEEAVQNFLENQLMNNHNLS